MAEISDVSLQQRLGRAMTDLGLEDRVVNDGYLPTIKIAERAALVEGVIDILLAKGRVRELFERVYLQTPMRGLFDGYDALPERVIEAVGKLKPESIVLDVGEYAHHERTAQVKQMYAHIAGMWSPDDVLRFAMLPQVKDPQTLMNPAWVRLSEAQQVSWHVHLGNLAMGAGAFRRAYKKFVEANDEARLDALFEKVMDAPENAGADVLVDFAIRNSYGSNTGKHIEGLREKIDAQRTRMYSALVQDPGTETLPILLELAGCDGMRMDAVFQSVMKKPELLSQKVNVDEYGRYNPTQLNSSSQLMLAEYFLRMGSKETNERWFLKRELTEEQRGALLDVVAAHTTGYGIDKSTDQVLRLRWAQLHWDKKPYEAYEIFRAQKYAGKEVSDAARKIVHDETSDYTEWDRMRAFIWKAAPEHLKALYDGAPRWIQPDIAERIGDPELLKAWSRTFFGSGQQHDVSRAYRFWMAAGGGEKPFADELRKALTDELVKKGQWWTPHDSRDDRKLFEMLCDGLLENTPYDAYTLAQKLGDDVRLDTARRKILEETGGKSYDFFRKKKDEIGFELSVGVLAKKYDVPADRLMPLLRKE